MTATETIGGTPVFNSAFYQFNPNIDEEDYAAQFDAALISAGFPATLGFLIDTSRNGWGGPTRPTGPSTSTAEPILRSCDTARDKASIHAGS